MSNIRDLSKRRKEIAEHEMNGDPFPTAPVSSTKADHARGWKGLREGVEAQIDEIAKERGWKVEYNGLMPTFITGKGDRALGRNKMETV
jgi:hypothetical protein